MQASYRPAALVRSAIILLLTLSCILPTRGDAACNAFPDYFMLNRTAPPQISPNVPVFRYRGAVGQVDQPYLLPAADGDAPEIVNLGPAVPCKPEATSVKLEARIIFTSGAKPIVVTVANGDRCAEVDAAAANATSYRALGCVTGTSIVRRFADGYCWSELTMADAAGWASLEAEAGSELVGDMRIVVTAPADPIAEEATTKSCADIADRFSGVACIDRLYVAKPGEKGTGRADVEPSACVFNRPPENDFAKLCVKSSPNHGKKCQHKIGDDTVEIYVDDCGNARIGFYYVKLLDPTLDPKKYRRRSLGGASVLPRLAGEAGGPIRIPGREYLASTDENGHGFANKPRLEPVFGSPAAQSTELRLDGDVDKSQSVLTLLPRRKATRVCANASPQEACEGIDAGETQLGCKDDRNSGVDECSKPDGGSRYFVCDSGLYTGQPCTRAKHCWPPDESDTTARCSATPKCWDPANKTLTTTECTDACEGALECSEPLFDLRSRLGQGDIVRLNRVPTGSERGVCDIPLTTNTQPPTCTSNDDCDAGIECVRYRLEAFDNVD